MVGAPSIVDVPRHPQALAPKCLTGSHRSPPPGPHLPPKPPPPGWPSQGSGQALWSPRPLATRGEGKGSSAPLDPSSRPALHPYIAHRGIPCGGKYESTNSGATKSVPLLKSERTNYVRLPMIAHEKQWALAMPSAYLHESLKHRTNCVQKFRTEFE